VTQESIKEVGAEAEEVVDVADEEENIEDEEVIVEAAGVKMGVSEEDEVEVVTEATEMEETEVKMEVSEEVEVVIEVTEMVDLRTENSDPAAIGVDPEGVVAEEVNLVAMAIDPNNLTAIEKMAIINKKPEQFGKL